ELCSEAERYSEKVKGKRGRQMVTSATIALNQLSMRLFDPWLGGTLVDSQLAATGHFLQSGDAPPSAEIFLSSSSGLLTPPFALEPLPLEPAALKLSLASDQLNVQLAAKLPSLAGELVADLQVANLLVAGGDQKLSGQISADFADLTMVSQFVPDIQGIAAALKLNAKLAGSLTQPRMDGFASLKGGLEVPALGLFLDPLQLTLRSDAEAIEKLTLTGSVSSGDGIINLDGHLDLATMIGGLQLQGENFEAMNSEINLLVNPDLQLAVDQEAIRLQGKVEIPYAYIIPPKEIASGALTASEDVVFVGSDTAQAKQRGLPFLSDIELLLGDKVEVHALGLSARLLGSMKISSDGHSATRASGSISVASGDYRLFGQDLSINRGSIIYTGGPLDSPSLDLRVSRMIDDVEAGARVYGSVNAPQTTLYSIPAMPDSAVMSYLLLGRGPGESSGSEQAMVMQATMALAMSGGNNIVSDFRDSFALDEIGFSEDTQGESAFFIGKYLTPDLYIRYGISLLEAMEVLTLSYRLSPMWRLESQSSREGSGGDLLFTQEY
ncbi:MAG: translocation/assembly module TamB domain-containing protein, partial [Gammaproteobacteria bacterium]|nr:translocation/assembly module TamB domain-containing protein [Gammaproteobacteria bacterium]